MPSLVSRPPFKGSPRPSPARPPAPPSFASSPNSKSARVRALLQESPNATNGEIASLVGCDAALVAQLREKAARRLTGADEATRWGALVSAKIPLSLQAKVLKDMLLSENPVSQGRALEIVLESRGLKRKIAEPTKAASILVQSDADAGFD